GARARAASRAEILDLALLACAAVVVVPAHRDAARARVALDHELHDRSGLAELGAVCVVREELLGREDAVWPDDVRILARIEDHLAETVGDVGGLEVSALQELLHDLVAADAQARRGVPADLPGADPVDRLEHRGRVARSEQADELTRIDETDGVARTIDL